jgi:hypothetical protein
MKSADNLFDKHRGFEPGRFAAADPCKTLI